MFACLLSRWFTLPLTMMAFACSDAPLQAGRDMRDSADASPSLVDVGEPDAEAPFRTNDASAGTGSTPPGDAGVSAPNDANAGAMAADSGADHLWNRSLAVPYYEQQTQSTCGPTSLSMLLAYQGITISQSTLATELAAIPLGVGRKQLSDYINANVPGHSSEILSGWDALKGEIAAGRPAIAQLGINSSDGTRPESWPISTGGAPVASSFDGGHFVVVVGLVADTSGNVAAVICNDPANWGKTYGDHAHYTANSFAVAWDDDLNTPRDLNIVTLKKNAP